MKASSPAGPPLTTPQLLSPLAPLMYQYPLLFIATVLLMTRNGGFGSVGDWVLLGFNRIHGGRERRKARKSNVICQTITNNLHNGPKPYVWKIWAGLQAREPFASRNFCGSLVILRILFFFFLALFV